LFVTLRLGGYVRGKGERRATRSDDDVELDQRGGRGILRTVVVSYWLDELLAFVFVLLIPVVKRVLAAGHVGSKISSLLFFYPWIFRGDQDFSVYPAHLFPSSKCGIHDANQKAYPGISIPFTLFVHACTHTSHRVTISLAQLRASTSST